MAPPPLTSGRPASRPAWGLAAVALAGTIALVHGAGGMPFFRDRLYYFLPQYDACRQAINAGEVPLWNPFTNCGQPLLATWQVGLGSPFSLPFLLLPWHHAVPAFWFLILSFAAAGTYALGLRAGLGPFGSAIAAVVYAGAAPLRTLGEWPNIVVSLAALPALLAAGVDLARGRAGATAAFGLLAALQLLAGQPRQVLMAALTVGLWLLALTAGPARGFGVRRNPGGSSSSRLAVAGLLALGAAAMQMLPTIELWTLSDRRLSGVPASTVRESFLHASDAWTLVFARGWGTEGRILDPHRLLTPRLYFGWIGLWLAALGLAAARGPVRRFALLSLPAGVLIAAGGPFLEAAIRFLGKEEPALRYLGHLVLIGWPGLCLLVGLGAERMAGKAGRRTPADGAWAAWIAAGAAAVAAFMWSPGGRLLAGAVAGADSVAAGRWLEAIRADALVAAGAVGAGWFAARSGAGAPVRRIALVAGLAADLGWAAHAHEIKAPAAAFPRPSAIDRFGLDRDRVFAPSWTIQVWNDDSPRTVLDHYQARWTLLSPNIPQVFRVHNAFGYEPLCLSATRELFGAFDNALGPVMPGVEATGVRWILGPLSDAPPGWRVREKLVGDWGLMESPLPRSSLLVLPSRASGLPWRSLARLTPAGTAAVQRETWNTLEIDVRSRTDAIVTPTTPSYPGWRASVNGVRRQLCRAGALFVAVPVPAGRSRVRLDYVPLSFALGLFLSSLALGAAATLGCVVFRR